MPRKYEGEPELSKREKMAAEIAAAKAEKPWHPAQLKGPFLPKKKPKKKPKQIWRNKPFI